MPRKTLEVELELDFHDRGTVSGVKRVDKGVKRLGTTAEKSSRSMKMLIGGLGVLVTGAAVMRFGRFMRSTIEDASEQQQVFQHTPYQLLRFSCS